MISLIYAQDSIVRVGAVANVEIRTGEEICRTNRAYSEEKSNSVPISMKF